jgi:hypothetical protein
MLERKLVDEENDEKLLRSCPRFCPRTLALGSQISPFPSDEWNSIEVVPHLPRESSSAKPRARREKN